MHERHPVLEPLARYLDDPEVTDLFVNGSSGLFVDRGRGASPAPEWRAREEDVRDLAIALIGLGGRHIDDATPCVDVRLEGGIRVHAVLPPVAAEGTAISIRVPRLDSPDLADLESRGMFDAETRVRLEDAVARRENLLITGAGRRGKDHAARGDARLRAGVGSHRHDRGRRGAAPASTRITSGSRRARPTSRGRGRSASRDS